MDISVGRHVACPPRRRHLALFERLFLNNDTNSRVMLCDAANQDRDFHIDALRVLYIDTQLLQTDGLRHATATQHVVTTLLKGRVILYGHWLPLVGHQGECKDGKSDLFLALRVVYFLGNERLDLLSDVELVNHGQVVAL